MSGTLSMALLLVLQQLVLHADARSLGSYAASSSSSDSGTTVHVHNLAATADVTVNVNHNLNGNNYVGVGHMPGHNPARALLRFESIPETCKYVAKAELFTFYYRAYLWEDFFYNFIDFTPKTVQVRQVLTSWDELEATWNNREAGQPWKKVGLELNDTDAAKEPEEDFQIIDQHTKPGYVKFDVTSIAQRWTAGDENNGLLLTLSDEETLGRELHFFSRGAESMKGFEVKPYLKVTCWSDFCAPLLQRRGGQAELLKQQQLQQASTTPTTPQETTIQREDSKIINSGGSTFVLPANSYH